MQSNKKFTKSTKFIKKKNNDYFDSLMEAQNIFIKLCMPPREDIDDIITNLKYLVNWRGYNLNVNVENDPILITKNENTYTFSKKQFLKNKKFIQNLIYKYNTSIGNVYLKIKQVDDNNFNIKITKKH